MRRFLILFVFLPIAIVVVVLSVAYRGSVTFSLNPLGEAGPGWSATGPFYVFLFAAVAFGIVIGGVATWFRQSRWRQAARVARADAEHLRAEVAALRQRVDSILALSDRRSDRDAA